MEPELPFLPGAGAYPIRSEPESLQDLGHPEPELKPEPPKKVAAPQHWIFTKGIKFFLNLPAESYCAESIFPGYNTLQRRVNRVPV